MSSWIKADIPNGFEDIMSESIISESVSELENILRYKDKDIIISLHPTYKKTLLELYPFANDIWLHVSSPTVSHILDKIRTVLLEWTLKLEEDNILGNDDLIFSETEKETARNIHIENFNGVMGNVQKLGNMSTGKNATNAYNENNISNEIDNLITKIKKLELEDQDQDQDQVVINLEASKKDTQKAKLVLGGLLARGAEMASISSVIIGILGLLG